MTRRTLVIAAALIPLLAQSTSSQSTSIRVDGNLIKSYIATMADEAHNGRRSLTPGHESSADWAAGLFKQWGLKPAGENGTYFQNVPILAGTSTYVYRAGTPELTIAGRPFLLRDNDFAVDPLSSPGPKVTADIVFVGYGISAPAKGLDEYTVDVKGKIVLAFKGSPKDAPPRSGGLGMPAAPGQPADTEAWTQESEDAFKAKIAYDKGAAAILLYSPPPPAAGGRGGRGGAAPAAPAAAPGAGRGGAQAATMSPFTRPFVVLSTIDDRVFRWITWRDATQSASEWNAVIGQMRRDIRDKKVRTVNTGLKATVGGYEAVALYTEKLKNNTSRNVLGRIEGSDPNLKSQYVVFGGHMDHMGVTNGVVSNGADDNASGTAVAMEVGRLLAATKVKPRRSVIVGLWTGEEQGLIGSRYYVNNPTDGVSMDRVVTYFNMDMVGLGDRIGAPGALNFPDIFKIIMRDQDPEVARIVDARTGGPGGSDHSGFIELGIEALALMTAGGGGHPDYHQSGDDVEKIEPAILAKTGQFVLQGVLNLANETEAQLLVPDRQHLYNAQALTVADMRAEAQPGAGGRGGGWRFINAGSSTELKSLAYDQAQQAAAAAAAAAAAPAAAPAVQGRGGGRGGGGAAARYTVGIRDARVFDGSVALLAQTAAALNFGRVDIAGNDGAWFSSSGGVSAQGLEAVKAMEAANVTANLINPSAKLLGDMLDATTRPFMVTVTGAATVDQALVSRMNQKNTVLLIECDPANAASCVSTLQRYKQQFGDSDNLVMSVKTAAADVVDAAKRTLYLTLIKNGWAREEILPVFGVSAPASGGGRGGAAAAGGNLSRLAVPAGGAGAGRGGV